MNGHLLDVLEVQPRAPRHRATAAVVRRSVQLAVRAVLLCCAVAGFYGLMWFCIWCAVEHRALVPYVAGSMVAGPLLVALVCALRRRRWAP